jgi:predicted DNA-binding protein
MTEDYIVETCKVSSEAASRLNRFATKYDVSKSSIIRHALDMYFEILESLEPMVWNALLNDIVKKSTREIKEKQS